MSNRLDQIKQLLEESPQDEFLLYAYALELEKAGSRHVAIETLEKMRVSHADYLPLYYRLAKWHEDTGNPTKAIQVYKEGIQLAKKQGDSKALGELNEALFFLDDPE